MIRQNLTIVDLNPIIIIFSCFACLIFHKFPLNSFVLFFNSKQASKLRREREEKIVFNFVMQLRLVPDKQAGSQLQINLYNWNLEMALKIKQDTNKQKKRPEKHEKSMFKGDIVAATCSCWNQLKFTVSCVVLLSFHDIFIMLTFCAIRQHCIEAQPLVSWEACLSRRQFRGFSLVMWKESFQWIGHSS